MRIQIIGLGIVGTAQAYLSKELGHEVVGYDIRSISHQYCKVNDSYVKDADITFICTPEAVVEEVIANLVNIGHEGLIVIKSTMPIGTTEQLSKKFKVHICHNPEFLRELTYMEDVIDPDMMVVGECCKEHGDLVQSFYEPMNKPIIRTNTAMSELTKLTLNAHLSALITFWNEIDEVCNKLNIDPKNLSKIIRHDPRISSYGTVFFGSPYGGKCLPKDTRHLIAGFRSYGLNPKLFEACESFNSYLVEKTKTKNDKLKNESKQDQI